MIFLPDSKKRPFVGCDYFAAMHPDFPWRQAYDVFKDVARPAMGVLWGTFGLKRRHLAHYCERVSDRPHMLLIHPFNFVCVEKGNCRRGELRPRLDRQQWNYKLRRERAWFQFRIKSRIAKITRTVDRIRNVNTIPVITTGLEDELGNKAVDVLSRYIREVWPYWVLRNPEGVNKRLPNFVDGMEAHGERAFGKSEFLSVSLDGNDITFPHRSPTVSPSFSTNDIRTALMRGKGRHETMRLWSGAWQGLTGDSRTAPPPRKRKPEVSRQDVTAVKKLLEGF